MPGNKVYSIGFPEEEITDYREGGFHPVYIGDQFKNKQYEILNKMGHGASATVWAAQDHYNNRIVCIKILMAEHSRDSHELEILRRIEAENSVHPGRKYLPRLLDHFYHDGINGRHTCLVLELLGPSLRDLLEDSETGRLSIPHARRVTRQLLQAIDFLHSLGFVHGDINDSNILLRLPNTIESPYNLSQVEKFEIRRIDEKPLEECLPKYLVDPAKCYEDVYDDLVDVQIIDFSSSFPIISPPKELITPSTFHPPEFIFRKPLSKAVDIWAVANIAVLIVTRQYLFASWSDSRPSILDMHETVGESSAHWLLTGITEALESGVWSDVPITGWQSCGISTLDLQIPWLYFHYNIKFSPEEGRIRVEHDLNTLSDLLKKMFVVDPAKRATARELLEDEWVRVKDDGEFDEDDYPEVVMPSDVELQQHDREDTQKYLEKKEKEKETQKQRWKRKG